MKIEKLKGQFFFHALFRAEDVTENNWELTTSYFGSYEEVAKYFSQGPIAIEFKWPVEEISPGCIYIPSEEELNEEK